MRASYENNGEYSCITIHIKPNEEGKALKVAGALISFGDWGMSHYDDEIFLLTNRDKNKTINEMKEDYREAKHQA